MNTRGGTLAALAAGLLGVSSAHAAPDDGLAVFDVEAQVPPFVLADRFSSPRLFNFEIGMLSPEETDVAWRFDVHGGWTNHWGLGAYLAFAFTHVTDTLLSWDDLVPGSPRKTPIGGRSGAANPELGVQLGLQRRFDVPLTLHIGVVAPIGASPTEGVNFLANALTMQMRVADAERFTFDAWWVRFGATTNGRRGVLVWQGDLGVSLGIPDEDYVEEVNPFVHVNLAVGADLGRLMVGAELASAAVIVDGDPSWLHELGLMLRARFGRTSLHAAYMVPFDTDATYGHALVMGVARVY